jgi:hypothetical protein
MHKILDFAQMVHSQLMLRASPWPAKGFALFDLPSIPPMNTSPVEAKSYNDCDTETILDNSAVTCLIPGCSSNNSHES